MSRRYQFYSAAWLALVLAACGGTSQPESPQPLAAGAQDTLPRVALEPPQAGMAVVYFFNASGWTLVGGGYTITLDGRRIAHLPRERYTWVRVAPGAHSMKAGTLKLDLTFEGGRTYFVAVAYHPGKSWAAPFAGRPFVFQEVGESSGREMVRQFRYQAAEGSAGAAVPPP